VGCSTNSVEGRENGDLGAVAPQSGGPLNLETSETYILIRFLQIYFPRNREFGSGLLKLWNFGHFEPQPPPPGTPLSSILRMVAETVVIFVMVMKLQCR
jgi:hypothetical protein